MQILVSINQSKTFTKLGQEQNKILQCFSPFEKPKAQSHDVDGNTSPKFFLYIVEESAILPSFLFLPFSFFSFFFH